MAHTYNRKDCKALIEAKNLPFDLTKIGGIDRLVPLQPNVSTTLAITNWDELYSWLSAQPSQAKELPEEGTEIPLGLSDEQLAELGKAQ